MSVWKEGDCMNLFPHQQQAMDRTRTFNNVAFFHDMGLG